MRLRWLTRVYEFPNEDRETYVTEVLQYYDTLLCLWVDIPNAQEEEIIKIT